MEAEDSEHAVVRKPVKSEAAFRTISEVSEDLDVPQHVLRFWESKFSQIKPLKRGGGRRYYRPEDLVLLKRIRDLLYKDGYTIRGVQKLLRDQSRGQVIADAKPEAAMAAVPEEPSPEAPSPASETASVVEAVTQAQLALEPAVPAAERLSSSHRKELQELLAELLELRSLLAKAHQG
ncbi:MerR family transcriptional regulator [Telmatospirillum siberiense]|uniref:MerR family transcriptional regulator n=1 Tax=Telmatospirillum siberiense TaxID=382514 RepID=A0A2N3PZ72_9PROT|nr:MerR family transcriptional regulator [Telmatospirillum siberiense]